MMPEDKHISKIAKYISFFRIRFISGLQYRAAALGGVVTQFAWGFMSILMFRAFYSENTDAFPMTFQAVASYIWLQQAFLSLFMPWVLENDIFKTITDGSIAYELCRPINIYNMWFVKNVASRLSKALLRSVPILLVAAFLRAPYELRPPASLHAVLWFLITAFLGLMVVVAFCMIIYILAFFTLSPLGLRILMTGLVEFLAGAIIPLPFLPEGIRIIIELLPFASIQNVPLRIYTGDISGVEIYARAGLQLFWFILLVFSGKLLIRKAERKVVVQGG